MDNKILTPYAQKIRAKEEKARQRIKPLSMLSESELKRIQEIVTLSSHSLELLNDLIDELRNFGVLGSKHLIYEYQAEMLKLQKFFIESSIQKGEEDERRKQQIRFERIFKAVAGMKAKKLNKLIDFINELENITTSTSGT